MNCFLSSERLTTGPQLIKAVKASGGEHQQPAKRSQWQTLARQLEIRLAMWQRHAAAAEAVAHRVSRSLHSYQFCMPDGVKGHPVAIARGASTESTQACTHC